MLAAGEPLSTTRSHSDSASSSTYDDHHSHSTCHKTSASMTTLRLPSPAIPPTLSHSHRSRFPSGRSNANPTSFGGARRHRDSRHKRSDSINSAPTTCSERSRRRIAKTVVKGAWRRYGMISANAALFAGWLATYCEYLSSRSPGNVCTHAYAVRVGSACLRQVWRCVPTWSGELSRSERYSTTVGSTDGWHRRVLHRGIGLLGKVSWSITIFAFFRSD